MTIKNLLVLLALFFTLFYMEESVSKNAVIILSSHNTVTLRGPVTEASVAKASVEILGLHSRLPKGKSIILFLDTPGGSISAGNALIELILGLPRKVVTVTSFAASMGYQIAQALSTRYILDSGTLMSHRASIGGLSGQVPGEANSRLKWISETVEEMEIKTAKRVGMSLKAYKEAIRDELWLTGRISVATNHADRVVKARCDESLQGVEKQEVQTMFGSVNATFHKCPLISGPVKVEYGEELTKNPYLFNKVKEEIDGYFSKKKGIWTL